MPSTLTGYRTATQRLLGTGSAGTLYSDTQLNDYINQARRQVAIEGQCIRALPAISGGVASIAVTSGGGGYSNGNVPVTISAPDLPSGQPPTPLGAQASALATVNSAGVVVAVTVLSAGAGYFAPLVALGGSGSGAGATATISGINATVAGQEVYPYAAASSVVATSGAGIGAVFMVNSISILWGNLRWTLDRAGWSKFQALARNYATAYQGPPAAWAQFGQGNAGSVYVQPIPDTRYPWEWDVCCLPLDLTVDTDAEALPFPWTDCVPYFAAYLAMQQDQRFADAEMMFKQYKLYETRSRGFSQPRGVNSWYGR